MLRGTVLLLCALLGARAQSWTGNIETFSYTADTQCGTGQSAAAITSMQAINSIVGDTLSACVQQTGAASGQQYWAKWTCSSATPGGRLDTIKCGTDATCASCTGELATYFTVQLPAGQGVCLDIESAGTAVAYKLTPPTTDPTDRAKYEAAMPPCIVDSIAPAPTPPPPTPTPATTCAACVAQDNRQWCWKASPAPGCFTSGDATSGCTEATATCTNPVDCQCSNCDDSAACGGPAPAPTPAPFADCNSCYQGQKEWCYATNSCVEPILGACEKSRSVCRQLDICDCHSCGAPCDAPPPAPVSACSGSSADLPADQCQGWVDMFDATAGGTWLRCYDSRLDPCSCIGSNGALTCANIVTRVERAAAAAEGRAAQATLTVNKIELYDSNMRGSLPATIGSFVDLETFDVSSNALYGGIPAEVTNWATLRAFDIGNCGFTGALPQYHLHPSLPTYWHSIEYLYVDGNLLSGAPLPQFDLSNMKPDRCHLLQATPANEFLCPWPAGAVGACARQRAGSTDWVPISDSDCVSGPTPPPTPRPPTPPPTPPAVPTTCDDCTAQSMLWCNADGTCKAEVASSGCSYFDAVCDNASWCRCSDCSDATCIPGAPTPPPPTPAPPTPPPAPSPGSWFGDQPTFTYATNTNCGAGKSPAAVSETTQIKRMADGVSSCAFQTFTDRSTSYNMWTCESTASGGRLTSVHCSDAACGTCDETRRSSYFISFVSYPDRGACLDSGAEGSTAYMLFPPQDDAAYNAAIAPCIVPPAPTPPTPPPPGPTWSGDGFTYTYTADSDCGAGKSPLPVSDTTSISRMADGLSACATQDLGDSSPTPHYNKWTCSSVAPGGTITSEKCTDATCSVCTPNGNTYAVTFQKTGLLGGGLGACLNPDSFSGSLSYMLVPPSDFSEDAKYEDAMAPCMVPPAPVPTPPPAPTPTPATTCAACVAQDNRQWCWKASPAPACFTPGDATSGCTEATATCTNPVDCQCSKCDDSAACGGPAPPSPAPPYPTPPPTPALGSCPACLATGMQWCWSSNSCMALGAGCTYAKAVCDEHNLCECQSCTDARCNPTGPTPPPPTPPPAPTPAPSPARQWTGVADLYEYEPNTDCDPQKRTPSTPIGSVVSITRLAWDQNAQCNHESLKPVAGQQLGVIFNYVRYACQGGATGTMLVRTICYSADCSTCSGEQTIYSVGYNDFGACLTANGKSGFEMDPPRNTDSGFVSHAMAACMVPPMRPPTPGPTPVSAASDSAPLGVGLGIGLPAVAAGMWFGHRRRQANLGLAPTMQQGRDANLLASQATAVGELGEMYSQL